VFRDALLHECSFLRCPGEGHELDPWDVLYIYVSPVLKLKFVGVILDLLELFEVLEVAYAADCRDQFIVAMLSICQTDEILIRSFIALFLSIQNRLDLPETPGTRQFP
jgi:hypothetical protein